MFKVESYITPILLSYVDKYIKNFRPQDSQVSLWGGDASFHNLDLRLEVLEEELQLPFSFVSGHIHELLIHVPWTKITSEPISITINTIECILKLRGEGSVSSDNINQNIVSSDTPKESRRKAGRRQEVAAPPGYVQSLVNKIVSNITIICNNLILKYVEEDIVLSVNVKTVSFWSANDKWEPALTELSPTHAILRKLIRLSDLTICLDKQNVSGKIELYQEPLLYRCSLEIRFLRNYLNSNRKQFSTTRIDVRCSRLDFGLTEQQVPMLMRLFLLAVALINKDLVPEKPYDTGSIASDHSLEEDSNELIQEGWVDWAWSFIPAVISTKEDDDSPTQGQTYFGPSSRFGFFVELVTITFKGTELDKSYYGSRKARFIPYLSAQLQGCFMDCTFLGIFWTDIQMGISHAILSPVGDCPCGVENSSDDPDNFYLEAGSIREHYWSDSLFDFDSIENKGTRRLYSISWDAHLHKFTEAVLLNKSPAFVVDYLYMLEPPDDVSSEKLSDLGSDLEYSNFPESTLCRIVMQGMTFSSSSGLLHRLQAVQQATQSYQYSPYSVPKPDIPREQLPPVTEDDFEGLEQNIPLQKYCIKISNIVVKVSLSDHPHFDFESVRNQRSRKQVPKIPLPSGISDDLPLLLVECECLDMSLVRPMYPRRLVTVTCRLPTPPERMVDACHIHTEVKVSNFQSQLAVSSKKRSKVIVPCSISFSRRSLLLQHYWTNPDIVHITYTLTTDSVTATCTRAQLLAMFDILGSFWSPGDGSAAIYTSTLISDIVQDEGAEVLEVCVENIRCVHVSTPITITSSADIGTFTAFVLEPSKSKKGETYQSPQVLVVSVPQKYSDVGTDQIKPEPLLKFILQMPVTTAVHPPPLLFLKMGEIRTCADPLLWRWLHYSPKPVLVRRTISVEEAQPKSDAPHRPKQMRKPSSESGGGGKRGAPLESVHSSSDHDRLAAPAPAPVAQRASSHDKQTRKESIKKEPESIEPAVEWWKEKILSWYPVWHGTVLCGDVGRCIIYIPTISLSAVEACSLEDALNHALKSEPQLNVLSLEFPAITFRCSTGNDNLRKFISQSTKFPIRPPKNLWTHDKKSFPWKVSLANFSCSSNQNNVWHYFLKPVSVNATVDVSASYKSDDSTVMSTLGASVYIDITPVVLSFSREQMLLMSSTLIENFKNASHLLGFNQDYKTDASTKEFRKTAPVVAPVFKGSTSSSQETPTTPGGADFRDTSLNGSKSPGLSNVKMSVWLQSTLEKMTVCVYTKNSMSTDGRNNLKLIYEMEDIMTSLDVQQVYLKLKCRVSSVSIRHYVRHSKTLVWKPGDYHGLVLKNNEELNAVSHRDPDDSGGFVNFTFTRASCQHAHGRWGARKRNTRLSSSWSSSGVSTSTPIQSRWISEISIKFQALDIVFSPAILSPFFCVLYPFPWASSEMQVTTDHNGNPLLSLNSVTLPLLYLDMNSTRFVVPASELLDVPHIHDMCMMHFDSVIVRPQAENPLQRKVIRRDIYLEAERRHILNIPGSDVEDRQYQADINGLSFNTATWRDFASCLKITSTGQRSSSTLRTMNENPALEWNNLMQGKESITPQVTLLPVMSRTDLCVNFAPVMLYQETVVCGMSLEVNAMSDIEISFGMGQLLLASSLFNEFLSFYESVLLKTESSGLSYYSTFSPSSESGLMAAATVSDADKMFDSGVDGISSASYDRGINLPPKEAATASSSGYKEHSSLQRISYAEFRLPPVQEVPKEKFEVGIVEYVPVEVLLTARKITCILYRISGQTDMHLEQVINLRKGNSSQKMSKSSYEVPSPDLDWGDVSVDSMLPFDKVVQPLLHILISQPHTYLSKTPLFHKMQISCFDFNIRTGTGDSSDCRGIPSLEHFPVFLLETTTGDPDLHTGVLPSFLTITWEKGIEKSTAFKVEFGRPTKFYLSLQRWKQMENMSSELKKIFCDVEAVVNDRSFRSDDSSGLKKDPLTHVVYASPNIHRSQVSIQEIDTLRDTYMSNDSFLSTLLSKFHLETKQLVFSVDANEGSRMVLSLMSVSCDICDSERLQKSRVSSKVSFDSVTLAMYIEDCSHVLLNPWSFIVNLNLQWRSWRTGDFTFPHAQVVMDSDCIFINVGPEHLRCLYLLWQTYESLLRPCLETEGGNAKKVESRAQDEEQHYRDDLRTGAFQYVMGNELLKDELPLPYQVVFWSSPSTMAWRYPQSRALTRIEVYPVPFRVTSAQANKKEQEQVFCSLQYWNDCRSCFQPFCTFQLSESETLNLNLPSSQHVIASVWRVILTVESSSPVRKDSPQNIVVPPQALAACMRVDSFFSPCLIPYIQVDFTISFCQTSLNNHIRNDGELPPLLESFMWDSLLPKSQEFMTVQLSQVSMLFSSWHSGKSILRIAGNLKCDIIDYAYLTYHGLIEPFEFSLNVSISEVKELMFISNPIAVRFSTADAHTLGTAAQIWNQALLKYTNPHSVCHQVIVTRYVICNDVVSAIRFGQNETDENILLGSRQCHFYTWRSQKTKTLLRFAVEHDDWTWSNPVSIDEVGTHICSFSDEHCEFKLFVKVSHVSETQKKIVIFGQLRIANLLMEHLDCVLISQTEESSQLDNGQCLIVAGRSSPASVLVNPSSNMALKIRFQGMDGAWSGNIPLKGNTKSGQPWLVKVPLHDKGQFLSIWCRIIHKNFNSSCMSILVILSPLYMIRSLLPTPAKVIIETPGLNVQLTSLARGRGEEHQLYCPGTIEHSHKLTFQLDTNIAPSDPYVPLSYTMVDQQKFFKCSKDDSTDIDDIILSLFAPSEPQWPFLKNDFEGYEWIAADQPETNVHIKYESKGPYFCTLLVELQPWALLINSSGFDLLVIIDEDEICRVPHLGIVAPPKLEGVFQIGLSLKDSMFFSQPLQLTSPTKPKSFYMPHIAGFIPLEGSTHTILQHDKLIGHVCVNSDMVKEIQILHVCPRYTFCNFTSEPLQVAIVELPKSEWINLSDLSLHGSPLPSNVSTPVIHIDTFGNITDDFAKYILFDKGAGWGQPVKLSSDILRKTFVVPSRNSEISNDSFILTVLEQHGQLFLNVHYDNNPQMKICNKCNFTLICAQCDVEEDYLPVAESFPIDWWCNINSNSASYYTFPNSSSKFPLVVPNSSIPPLLISVPDTEPLQWSAPINFIENYEQYVRLPGYGEVKISMEMKCHTNHITIEIVDSKEISAKVIRSRLSHDVKHPEKLHKSLLSESIAPVIHKPNFDSSIKEATAKIKNDEKNERTFEDNNEHKFAVWKIDTVFKSLSVTFVDSVKPNSYEKTEVIALCLDGICITVDSKISPRLLKETEVMMSVLDLQLDNQMFECGEFDFPVILISQLPCKQSMTSFHLTTPIQELISAVRQNNCLTVTMHLESAFTNTAIKNVNVTLNPLCAYIEDTLVIKLRDYFKNLLPDHVIFSPDTSSSSSFGLPKNVVWNSVGLANPLFLRALVVEPLFLLTSIHTSMPLFIALDHSPLTFDQFERRNIVTTSYELGRALALHYIYNAIFGAGWMVGSLELLGSPGGLARTVGTGLKDFVNLPYHGILQSPWGFLVGFTHGSASLLKHLTAGTVSSVTKLASSVARNLDRLALDEEHLKRMEESRRQRPQGVTQGLMQGLTGLGMSLLSAIGGITHHPFQKMINEGVTPINLVTGVGLGLVGVVTKPLSGAAEFVAKTGQGLLNGTGWSTMSETRNNSLVEHVFCMLNSKLKYDWKFVDDTFLVLEAMHVTSADTLEPVALALTSTALFVIDTARDVISRILTLAELSCDKDQTNSETLKFHIQNTTELEAAARARIEEFVRCATINQDNYENVSELESSSSACETVASDSVLTFRVSQQSRNYFIALFTLLKRQDQGKGFCVL